MSNDNGSYAILLQNTVGRKKEKSLLKSGVSNFEVLKGALLIIRPDISISRPALNQVLSSLDHEGVEIETSDKIYEEIQVDTLKLLQPIPNCNERFSVYQDKEWLGDGMRLKVGDLVTVWVKGQPDAVVGKLRYKGDIPELKGTYFGVELLGTQGLGTCDGTFRKKTYFTCAPESAVFVGLHKLRKCDDRSYFSSVSEGMEDRLVASANVTVSCRLRVGDRVVWMSDNGPEGGVVKWVGILPDAHHSQDVTVGVEFDNQVGSGTGKYKNQRLFHAKQGHASLVPVLGLIKEDEFYPSSASGDNVLQDYEVFRSEGAYGKTQEEVIEEQKRLLEQAQRQTKVAPIPIDSIEIPISAHQQLVKDQANKQKYYEDTSRNEYKLNQPSSSSHYASSGVLPNVHLPQSTIPPSHPHDIRGPDKYRGEEIGSEGSEIVNPLYEYHNKRELKGELESELTGQSKSSRSLQKPIPEPDPDLEVGSMVEVMSDTPLYGLIRWIGNLPDQKEPKKLIAGLEMEEEISAGTDGTFSKHRLFTCPPKKAFFVPLYKCRKDKRFLDNLRRSRSVGSTNFGSIETPDVHGTVSPPDSLEVMNTICGKNKGIQGHHNSCYMDATLLSMFYFTTVFDSLLHRPLEQHEEVRSVLKEGIVNPLRKYHYVRADKVMKLRQLLDKLGNIKGMMSEEKDPEEFLSLLLNNITKAEPFLHISSASNHGTQLSYFYQMIMDKDERLVLPTTQQLFELSFLQMGIKLREEPSCLIIQMPRFGKDYKMYRRIIPSLELDITDVLENAPRECIICGDLAYFECTECYQVHGAGLNTIAFCEGCKKTSHHHKQRQHHKPRKINIPEAFACENTRVRAEGGTLTIPRAKMELFAVICIQTSHYVSFVKCGKGLGAPWIFFDSMADRMGEQSGYNIPEVTLCEDLPSWLTVEKTSEIMRVEDDKALPEHMRRLVCDAYICMYQSPDVMMFK